MKELEKEYLKDILYVIIYVLITIPVWIYFNANKVEYNVDDFIQYEFLNHPSYTLLPVSDEYALKYIETQDIVVYNNSYTSDNYVLMLEIKENTNVDNIKINVNYKVSYLKEYNSFYKDGANYYILDNNSLNAESKKYNISLWNTEGVENEVDILDHNFIVSNQI